MNNLENLLKGGLWGQLVGRMGNAIIKAEYHLDERTAVKGIEMWG